MTETEVEITREQREVYARLLQNMSQWASLMKTGGPGKAFLEIDGEEFCYFSMLDGMDTLTPTQRQAVYYVYICDMKVDDAAKKMGTPNAPVRQYAEMGVEKLCRFKHLADRGMPLPKMKSTPSTRKAL